MNITGIYQDPQFTNWILSATPDYIIDILSNQKPNFKKVREPLTKPYLTGVMRKKKIIDITKDKKRLFDFQKSIPPIYIYNWSLQDDEPLEELKKDKNKDISEYIYRLYEESNINNEQQLATQLYFVQDFKAAYEIFSNEVLQKTEVEATAVKERPLNNLNNEKAADVVKNDKQIKKLMKEVEKRKEELSKLRTQQTKDLKLVKESLDDKKKELFVIKKTIKQFEDEATLFKKKYEEEVALRQEKEEVLKKDFYKQLDDKDHEIYELEKKVKYLHNQLQMTTQPSEVVAVSQPVKEETGLTGIDDELLSQLAFTMKNRPDKEVGYSVRQQDVLPKILKSTVWSKENQKTVAILGNPRNSTLLRMTSHNVQVFENEECLSFIEVAATSDKAFLYKPRYLAEEFDRLTTEEVKNKAEIIHSFQELKQQLEAL